MRLSKPAIVASLDSSWISSKDIDYSINYVKTSLVFFNQLYIDDSELIDSNQMRYAMENGFSELIEKGLVKITKRSDSIKNTLLELINREPPMLFSSLDYISNEKLQSLGRSRQLTLEELYEQFNHSDVRLGLDQSLKRYSEYIEHLEKIAEKAQISAFQRNPFGEKIAKFSGKLGQVGIPSFNNRTEVYTYIESIRRENLGEAMVIKKSIKSLADLIYILNKSYFLDVERDIFVIFDKAHLEEIERDLSAINVTVEDVKSLYKDKEINIVKLNIRPIRYDRDVHFFFNRIVPTDIIIRDNEDFFKSLEKYLESKNDYERLSYLKFTKRREKYSKVIERRFPRARSLIEISVLVLILIQISFDLIFNVGLSPYQIAYTVVGFAVFLDGLLGFIEYSGSKKINTVLYDKILKWYKEHLETLK